MSGNKDESIQKKITTIDGLGGMTVNERLHVSELIKYFETSKLHDKARARQILTWLKVDEPSIALILEQH